MNESEGNRNAVNQNIDGSYDVGLWQINSFNWDVCNGGKTPCDTADNLRCAIDIYRWGRNTWSLWTACEMCNACNSP